MTAEIEQYWLDITFKGDHALIAILLGIIAYLL